MKKFRNYELGRKERKDLKEKAGNNVLVLMKTAFYPQISVINADLKK